MHPPIVRLTVSASDSTDDKRLQTALVEIAAQDPTLRVGAQQMGIAHSVEGTSASHLESICNRLRVEYHLAINVSPTEAVLVETIRKQAEAEGKYIRQTGGSGNYGHCKLRIEPGELGEGYEFINAIKGGKIPSDYIESIDQGIEAAMRQGVLAGFPVVDVRVTLYDGSYHDTDSNPIAFSFAASIAFKEAAKRASPVLLEPMMALEIEVPEELVGLARHEVYTHRGRIESNVAANGFSEIKAVVPLSEILASASGVFDEAPKEFAGYEPARDDRSPDENGSGVTANRPGGPRPRRRSEVAQPEPEDE
jgi:elongation factor G